MRSHADAGRTTENGSSTTREKTTTVTKIDRTGIAIIMDMTGQIGCTDSRLVMVYTDKQCLQIFLL